MLFLSIYPHIFTFRSVWFCNTYRDFVAEMDEWEIAPRFSDLLANTDVQFVQDRVKLLHPSCDKPTSGALRYSCAGSVQLESDLLIEYDWY